MTKRLTGRNPLSYIGVEALKPPDYFTVNRPPTINDYIDFNIGDIWLDTNTNVPPQAENVWMLVSKRMQIATWINFGPGAAGVQTLSGDSGINPVLPDGANNINVFGDNTVGLTVVGDGVNTLTVTTTTGNPILQTLTGDIGGAVGPDAAGNIDVITNRATVNAGSSVLIAGNPGTNTLTLNVTDSNDNTLIGNSAGNLILTSARCTGIGFEVLDALTSGVDNTAVGWDAGTSLTTGNRNCLFGDSAGAAITTSSDNTCLGSEAGQVMNAPATRNTFVGRSAGTAITTATDCVYVGYNSGLTPTIGSQNTAIGSQTLDGFLGGTGNIAVGFLAGSALAANESDNILIGHAGVLGNNASIRVGTLGTQTTCFVQGIAGVSIANELPVVINSVTGQLGTGPNVVAIQYTTDAGIAVPAANNLNIFGAHGINTSGAGDTVTVAINNTITLGDLAVVTTGNDALTITSGNITLSGTGVNAAGNINMPATTVDGRQGVYTVGGNRFIHDFGGNSACVFVGPNAGNINVANVGINNCAFGSSALAAVTSGDFCVAIGDTSLNACTTGDANVGCGSGTYQQLTTGSSNCAFGHLAGQFVTSGNTNTIIGTRASHAVLTGLVTGSNNVIIGADAGNSYTAAESSNLIIGTNQPGVNGENNTIRIGVSGAGAGQQNRCFIAGIRGITTGINNAIAVLIDSADQLGTASSSLRHKHNIENLGADSEIIYQLRPVKFNFKQHPDVPAWGLIAEEVAETFPQLAVYDKEGWPDSVKYHELSVLLLNELQKLNKRVKKLEDKISLCTYCN